MRRYVLDTNLYIAADRDRARAEELIAFYAAFLPFTYLHATVVQELLLGARDARRGRQIQEAYVAPFEARGRVITPSYRAWKRSGEMMAALIQQGVISPGGLRRSFLNDALLATSCRESGATLVTANTDDFERLQEVEPFDFVRPWPTAT